MKNPLLDFSEPAVNNGTRELGANGVISKEAPTTHIRRIYARRR